MIQPITFLTPLQSFQKVKKVRDPDSYGKNVRDLIVNSRLNLQMLLMQKWHFYAFEPVLGCIKYIFGL